MNIQSFKFKIDTKFIDRRDDIMYFSKKGQKKKFRQPPLFLRVLLFGKREGTPPPHSVYNRLCIQVKR